MITHYDIRHAVLERNPYFHEWSRDAQPDGYPDRIVWRLYKKTGQAVSAVEHGTADWLYHVPGSQHTADPRDRNQLRRPDPPIRLSRHRLARDCNRTRRWGAITSRGTAIAHAIDRPRLARMIEGGGSSLVTTCQRIPPNFPGYRRYCPYSLEPALAQTLVHRSPSYGKPVAVFSWDGPAPGRYVVELLNTLGFRARLVPAGEDGFPTEDHLDVQVYSWAMDYLGASDFIQLLGPEPLTASELSAVRRSRAKVSIRARAPGRPPTNASPTSRW